MTHHTIYPRPALSKGTILTRQAERWARYVLKATDLKESYVRKKTISSARFSSEIGAASFAVPSKLYGTRDRQEALRTLSELRPVKGHRLGVTETTEGLVVSFADVILGYVQRKHAPWLRPLLERGASVHLLAVTGTDHPRKYFGCNCAFARVSEAIWRLDGHTHGDGLPAASAAPDVEPVRLWRDETGEACSNVEHIVRHSPTGIGWGGVSAGGSDLSYSILYHVAGEEAAERHTHLFLHQVISRVPREGATLQPEAVRQWLRRQKGA